MTAVWISDFRGKQIQQYQHKCKENFDDHKYIIESAADFTWFNTNAVAQLPLLSVGTANIIIMLGFNDCAYSCAWDSFNIDKISADYANVINELIKQYQSFKFYICTVNPIDAPYPFTGYAGGIIPVDTLNAKIKRFNKTLADKCSATFIDSYKYLTLTSFKTRDGVRFTWDTCAVLQKYILSSISDSSHPVAAPANFEPIRNTKAHAPDPDDESYLYWVHTSAGGYNTCSKMTSGSVLPNCTGYAWGRFMEILGNTPKLSRADAGKWFRYEIDGYERGQVPRPGAVICWEEPDKAGHVAIVEQVNEDNGTIITSESGFNTDTGWSSVYVPEEDFWVTTRVFDQNNWRAADTNGKPKSSWIDSYKFQGFIYNPAVTSSCVIKSYVHKDQVISGNFALSRAEMEINAQYIWQYLGNKGWSINAVAGILGNMETESNINPGLWQSKRPWGSTDGHGYGLVQWTPYTKFTDWCDEQGYDMNDIDTALVRIEKEVEASSTPGWSDLDQWIATAKYDMTFKEFTTSKLSAYELGKVFLLNYERPKNQSEDKQHTRGKQAESWYNFLLQYAPEPPITFSLNNLKIDKLLPTSLEASFIVRACTSAKYQVVDSSGKQIGSEQTLTVDASKDGTQLITFIFKGLKPNNTYELRVQATGNSKADKIEEKLSFSTPQAIPSTVSSIRLTASDTKLPNNKFLLETALLSNTEWGYWRTNKKGYTIQLLVNGQIKQENIKEHLAASWPFKLDEEFSNYKSKIGDTIQIGIRTWVVTDNGEFVYDNEFTKTSNPICFLKQPVIIHLNY